MGWTNLPATQATDWTHVDFLNQFVEAYNERVEGWVYRNDDNSSSYEALKMAPVQAGDYPAYANPDFDFYHYDKVDGPLSRCKFSIQTLQHHLIWSGSLIPWVNWEAVSLFDHFDLFDNDIDDHAYTPESAFRAAGIIDGGTAWDNRWDTDLPFTRKVPRYIDATPSPAVGMRAYDTAASRGVFEYDGSDWILIDGPATPDTVTLRGIYRVGDYVGPWIWNELQSLYNILTAVAHNESLTAQSLSITRYEGLGQGGFDEANAESLANWGEGSTTGFVNLGSIGNAHVKGSGLDVWRFAAKAAITNYTRVPDFAMSIIAGPTFRQAQSGLQPLSERELATIDGHGVVRADKPSGVGTVDFDGFVGSDQPVVLYDSDDFLVGARGGYDLWFVKNYAVTDGFAYT